MDKKRRNGHIKVRVCEVCGNEIYKYNKVKCPYCGNINQKITSRKEMVTC